MDGVPDHTGPTTMQTFPFRQTGSEALEWVGFGEQAGRKA